MSRRLVALATAFCVLDAAYASDFDAYEVRVIRPKYMIKKDRPELGVGMTVIMNQSFIYSVLATGIATWHLSETLAIESHAAYGRSFDKDAKARLRSAFNIRTIVLRTESILDTRVAWTPAYGKFELTNRRVVYFDTFVNAGVGLAGVRYTYDHCDEPSDYPPPVRDRVPDRPSEAVKQYPAAVLGIGQRFFLNTETSLRLGLDMQRIFYDRSDGTCNPQAVQPDSAIEDNVLLTIGYTFFF